MIIKNKSGSCLTLILLYSMCTLAFAAPRPLPLTLIGDFVDYRGLAVFSHIDEFIGQELLISDGSPLGTRLIKDIEPGPGGSWPTTPVVWGNNIYFFARDTEVGWSLWTSDGTEDGTIAIAPGVLPPTSFISGIEFIGEVNGTAYFSGFDNVLISTRGTKATTNVERFEISSGAGSTTVNGRLFFTPDSSTPNPVLFSANGQGQFAQVANQFNLENGACNIGFIEGNFSGQAMFIISAFQGSDRFGGCENRFWFTEGSPTETRESLALRGMSLLGVINNQMVLIDRSDSTGPSNIFVSSNGFVLDLIGTVNSLVTSTRVNSARVLGDKVAVSAGLDGTYLIGTTDGDIELIPINSTQGDIFQLPNGMIIGKSIENRNDLLISDGTSSGTRFLSSFGLAESWSISQNLLAGNGAYVQINENRQGDRNTDLWHTDGTPAGTNLVVDAGRDIGQEPGFNTVSPIATEGNRLFFDLFRFDPFFSEQVWQTDGTAENTYQLFYTLPGVNIVVDDDDGNQITLPWILNLLLEEEDD